MLAMRPGLGGPPFPPTSSLYEMAALTNELDTQTITTKVKEILLQHNVGQKVSFTEIASSLALLIFCCR